MPCWQYGWFLWFLHVDYLTSLNGNISLYHKFEITHEIILVENKVLTNVSTFLQSPVVRQFRFQTKALPLRLARILSKALKILPIELSFILRYK